MKKLIFLLLLVSFLAKAQYPTWGYAITNDTIFVANQVSDDSVYFKAWRAPLGGSVTFEFTNVDATDATITFGYSPDGVVLVPVSNGSFTLDNTDVDLECYISDGSVKYCKSFTEDNWSYKSIGWLFDKGTLTNDTIPIKFCK